MTGALRSSDSPSRRLRERIPGYNPPSHGRVAGATGFSMPELIISSIILAIAVLASAQLFNSSNRLNVDTSQRNNNESLIDTDLTAISKRNEHFSCKGSTSCAIPITTHSIDNYFPSNPAEIVAFETLCTTGTQLVDLLIAQINAAQPAPAGVERGIAATPMAGHTSSHLYTVTYYSDATRTTRLRQVVFTPTVAAWCP